MWTGYVVLQTSTKAFQAQSETDKLCMSVCISKLAVGEPTLWCAPGQGEGAEVARGPQGYTAHCHRRWGEEEDNRGCEEEGLGEVVGHIHYQWVPMAREVMYPWTDGRVSRLAFYTAS